MVVLYPHPARGGGLGLHRFIARIECVTLIQCHISTVKAFDFHVAVMMLSNHITPTSIFLFDDTVGLCLTVPSASKVFRGQP